MYVSMVLVVSAFPLRCPVRLADMKSVKTHAQNLAQQDQWAILNVRTVFDPHQHGTHAGLPHFRLDITHNGVKVGYADLHLHHNKHGLSVGTTVCCYTRSEKGTFTPARPVED